MWILVDVTIFAAGFAACWISKDTMARMVTGTEALAKALEARAAALRALL